VTESQFNLAHGGKTKDGYAQKLARPGEKRVNGGKDFGKR